MRSLFGAVQLCWAMALSAHVLLEAGPIQEVRDLLASAEKAQAATHDRSMEAEFLRMCGRLAELDGDPDAAANKYRDAMAIAERQGAKLFSLRTALDLARLHRCNGRTSDTVAVLKPIHDSFTGGSDCPEMAEAKTLLGEAVRV